VRLRGRLNQGCSGRASIESTQPDVWHSPRTCFIRPRLRERSRPRKGRGDDPRPKPLELNGGAGEDRTPDLLSAMPDRGVFAAAEPLGDTRHRGPGRRNGPRRRVDRVEPREAAPESFPPPRKFARRQRPRPGSDDRHRLQYRPPKRDPGRDCPQTRSPACSSRALTCSMSLGRRPSMTPHTVASSIVS